MGHPWTGITLVGAFWNCADRAETLLTAMRPWFQSIVIAVQESQDDTLARVQAIADVTIPDTWHGHGNASFQKTINAAKTPWCFLISDDEMPSEDLLAGMQEQVDWAAEKKYEGLWYHFVSSIDGFDFTREQDNHLRLFLRRWGWPSTIHSRPMIPMDRTGFWPGDKGHIRHDRTLDEMMLDYLRRYRIGQGNKQWENHNKQMMVGACKAIADKSGAAYVMAFPWWKQVSDLTGLTLEGG